MYSLNNMITDGSVQLGVSAENWEEAIRIGGSLLKKNGFITQQYIDAMVDTCKELGPYIVIAPGLAMPHSAPEKGVIKPAVSLITLSQPVEFGNKDHDPVSVVFCIAATKDHDQLVAALTQITGIASNSNTFNKLIVANSLEDVKSIIDDLENSFI
ncbi:PTS sugar transporter subunit IIA [Bacillus sp. FJAT-50079]|uniref:PTS sugar transporter subunit IIA n=1 Tax=Bacillus sp. FJAT-50079 TaxID=2833577 RepID=UPI001BC9B327|nr:PTS sugar transporter subunit IIA [Bacillus sp. FJAT-50079]MBS4210185.1 PTS sugar transporter subunit IIA [Bacillus sp. FJAT-50079]